MKNVIILGSTGSIGTQALEVIEKLEDYNVLGLSCGKNIELLKSQISKFKPKVVCCEFEKDAIAIQKEFNIEAFSNEQGLIELAKRNDYDILLVATNGTIALKAVLEAIKNQKTIALANKETLVMAGEIVTREAKKYKANIVPVDSEHSAILQCLNNNEKFAKRLWITASGGPFLNNTREEMKSFTFQDALKHPKWNMGKKITIDCATLVNKGLEVIEAHHLFDFNYDDIKVVIHPQSLVHSFVEFQDGSFLAQMGLASMHIPIQYALTYPNRMSGIKTDSFCPYNQKLEFFEPDFEKFPLLKLTIEAGKKGGIYPVVLNTANEIAVYRFLKGEISFLDIEKTIYKALDNTNNIQNPTLEDILEIDKITKQKLGFYA
ncbi:1-deoxy-D-xylulose-5-phosphate reductoisomerase [bacterium]|nr:1-deoxy-D-xylulose-5-phosphate reductoisomerase [bacterium]